VAVEATGINIEQVTTSPLTGHVTITPANCQENVSYANNFVSFGTGAFTAHQLLLGSNGSRFVVLPTGLNKVLSLAAGSAPANITLPAGATQPFTGGLSLDGNTLWIGVDGTNTVDRVNLVSGTDDVHLSLGFKKSDGSTAPPDLVAVQPR
jgi:hypothetical protein